MISIQLRSKWTLSTTWTTPLVARMSLAVTLAQFAITTSCPWYQWWKWRWWWWRWWWWWWCWWKWWWKWWCWWWWHLFRLGAIHSGPDLATSWALGRQKSFVLIHNHHSQLSVTTISGNYQWQHYSKWNSYHNQLQQGKGGEKRFNGNTFRNTTHHLATGVFTNVYEWGSWPRV